MEREIAKSFKSTDIRVNTVRVVVFKDGYCMFVKKVVGKLDSAARAVIEGIPEAMVLGTFWVIPQNGKLASVVAKQQIIPRKARQENEKCLVLEFESKMANKNVEVMLFYFGPGLRWIPTYRIALNDGNKCHLMMQAEILNEAEDLDDVQMELVVGVPNFRFKDVISPLSLEATLQNILQESAPQVMGNIHSNFLMTQRVSDADISSPRAPAIPTELGGEKSQDLFIYKVPETTLRVGERAIIPIISTELSFKHLYTWDVQLSRSNVDMLPARGSQTSPIKLSKNEVWHQIELDNQTDVPWTTGPALIMDEFLPLAQELLTYTSRGGKCQVPLSVAIDIRGTYSEEEIKREVNAIRFDGYDYIRITKRGALKVINYKEEPIELWITCDLGGNAEQATHDGIVTISDFKREDWGEFRGDKALTGHSTIQWKLNLEAGETKEVACEYFYYIR
ncbi:MAG: hypothetical protein ACFFBD_20465 [Candidatus Hodarchaeota archaeon]